MVPSLLIKNGKIVALSFLGEHSDLNIESKLSYYININGKKLMFAAASNNLDELLFDLIGSIRYGM